MAISEERMVALLAYCHLEELWDDPEVQQTIPVLYAAAVEYMAGAGVSEPREGAGRRALYDLCINHLVLSMFDRRETFIVGTSAVSNPAFRQMLVQLKLTEPADVSNLDTEKE